MQHSLRQMNWWYDTGVPKGIDIPDKNGRTKLILCLIRSPVIIFLSDGECSMTDSIMYDLCRTAIRLGWLLSYITWISFLIYFTLTSRAVSFHSVSFGSERYSAWLRRMVDIAKEIQGAAPRDPLLSANAIVESSYNIALDSVCYLKSHMPGSLYWRLVGSACWNILRNRWLATKNAWRINTLVIV